MKWVLLVIIFASTFAAGFFVTKYIFSKYNRVKAQPLKLDPITSSSPTLTSTPTATVTSTPIIIYTPTPTPSPTHVPQPVLSAQEIHKLMERFASQYGVDVNVLRHIAVCESGFNPSATNRNYAGLFQFNKTTWENNRRLMGEDPNVDLRYNAEESVQTASFIISKGKNYIWPNCYPK